MSIGNKIAQYRWLVVVGGVLLGFIASASLVDRAFAQTDEQVIVDGTHIISIYDRGQERTIVTKATDVRGALAAAGVEVHDGHDVVEPALDTELVASKYNVNIYRARPIVIVDGSVRQRVTTAHQTPEQIAEAAGVTIYKEDKVTIGATSELLVNGVDAVMEIDRAIPVELLLYGKKTTLRTHAETVGELLKEHNITVERNDTLSVPASTPITAGMTIELWRDGVQTVTVEEEVDFPVEQVRDANREVGYREVKEAGQKGVRTVTYEVEMQGGKEVGREEIASVTTKEPKKQVEIVGVKPVTMPYTGGGNKDTWLAASAIPRDQWGYTDYLVQRESGWNPNAVNTSSGACGLGQQLPCGKWDNHGPWNDPIAGLNGMHSYVMGRYGSWEAAVAHSQARGWY